MRVAIGGIGYSNQKDLSFGRTILPRLEQEPWPDYVDIHDLSYGPILVYQALEEAPFKYDKAIIVTAAITGAPAGTLRVYEWDFPKLDPIDVQAKIGEAVTGVISLDNLLVICQHFNVLPPRIVVVEMAAEDETWGMDLSPEVAARVEDAVELVRREVFSGSETSAQ